MYYNKTLYIFFYSLPRHTAPDVDYLFLTTNISGLLSFRLTYKNAHIHILDSGAIKTTALEYIKIETNIVISF
jgi:hypothetical protein